MNRSSFNPDNSTEDQLPDWMKASRSAESGFKVPVNYFEELPGRIEQTIRKEETGPQLNNAGSSTTRRIIIYRIAPLLAAASVIIALFFLFPVSKTSNVASNNTNDSLNLTASYDASYATEAIQDEYVLMNEMLDDPDAQLNVETSSDFYESNEISDEDITDYLMDQDIDTDLLAEL